MLQSVTTAPERQIRRYWSLAWAEWRVRFRPFGLGVRLVVALLAFAATACSSSSPAGSSARPTQPSVRATKLVIYAPFTEDGKLASNLRVVQTARAEWCGDSFASPRQDTFRCGIRGKDAGGSNIEDPCFMVEQDDRTLYCVNSPTATDVIRVSTTHTRPPPENHMRIGRDPSQDLTRVPWVIMTADGEICTGLPGTGSVLAGMRRNYQCPDGRGLYGFPDRTQPVWRIWSRPKDSASMTRTAIATAWF